VEYPTAGQPLQQPGGRAFSGNTAGKRRYPMDLPFLLLTLLLLTVGLLMLLSASYARAYEETGQSAYYFIRQGRYALLGLAAMFAITRVNYQLWRWLSPFLMAGAVLLLLLVLLIGSSEGGAQRWLVLGPINFQPSELAKLAVVTLFAAMIASFREKMQTFTWGVLPFAGILLVLSAMLLLQPHLSATVIICGVGAVMMFLGGTKLRWFAILAVLAGIGLVILTSTGYAARRIEAWQNPWLDQRGGGYQVVQALYAVGSGGLFGLGFGKSRQKYLYLPEEHNDYIFPIVCEELGFVGAGLIILLFVLLILRGYWIAMHARDRFGSLLVSGLTTLLAIQVFLNVGVVTNFLPATGISLPFFSYGGTALMVQLAEMGMILAVSRSNRDTLL